MENLPDEVLDMIFEYISAPELSWVMSNVSRRWRDLIATRVVIVRRAKECENFRMSLRRIQMIYANADDRKLCARLIILKAIELAPRLRELTLSVDIPLCKRDFRILRKLVHLYHLDVFTQKDLFDGCVVIGKNIKSLVVNETVSGEFLDSLKHNQLTGFHMYGRARHYMPNQLAVFLTVQAPYLRDITLRCQIMTDTRYAVLGQCVNLKSLQLFSCHMMTKKGFNPIMGLKQLLRLHITGTSMLHDQSLLEVVESLPLSVVDVNLSASYFQKDHCAALAARLPALRKLQLWRCNVHGEHLLYLARRLPLLEDLDTDVQLRAWQIRLLECQNHHLRSLRCRWLEEVATCLQLWPAAEVHPGEFLLQSYEGPSSDLFYFWLRDVPLRAVERRPQPPSPTCCCAPRLFPCRRL